MKRPKFTQTELTKALKAAIAAGLKPSAAKITLNGDVLLNFVDPLPSPYGVGDDSIERELAQHFGR